MKMMKRTLLAVVLMVVLLCQSALAAGDVGRITLSQVQQRGGEITMYASVLDETGNQVHGLSSDQFSVWVDSSFSLPAENLTQFDTASTGIHYVIAVDISGSIQKKQMNDIKAGLTDLAEKMTGLDRVTLITFGNAFTTLLDQGDKSRFITAIDSLKRGENKTALYGGVQEAISKAKSNSMRSVVIVITDGKDESLGDMANYTKESIWQKVVEAQVPLYCIGVNNKKLDTESLKEFADMTGGAQYVIESGSVSNTLSTIRSIIVGSVVIRTTLWNYYNPPKQGKAETEFYLTCLPANVNAGEVDSNNLSQMINWSSIPAPTPSPTPVVTPEIELQMSMNELKYTGEPVKITGIVKVAKGEVEPEDIVISVDDTQWRTDASRNGSNIAFDATGMLPGNKSSVFVRASINRLDVRSNSVVLKVTPSDTPTPSPAPTPEPKLDLQIDEITDTYEQGKNLRITGTVSVDGSISGDDLRLYVNDMETEARFEYLNASAYAFSVDTVMDQPEMLVQVKAQSMDLNSRRYKLPLATPSPTPAPQLSVVLDRNSITYEVGKAFDISGSINVTGNVNQEDLVLVVSNIPTSFDSIEYNPDTNSYTFVARSTLADDSRQNLGVQVMLKDEIDVKGEATVVMVTPTPSPTPTPTPKPAIITPPPSVDPAPVVEEVTPTPSPTPTPEPGFPQNVVYKAQSLVKSQLEAGRLWLLIVLAVVALALIALLIVLLARGAKRKGNKKNNGVENTSFNDENRDLLDTAPPTQLEDNLEQPGNPTVGDDAPGAYSGGQSGPMTYHSMTVDVNDAREYEFSQGSGGTVLSDEEFEYSGGTVLADDEEDMPTIDVHMVERNRNGRQQSHDLTLTMGDDLAFGRIGCGAAVEIDDQMVSAHHMLLTFDGEKIFIMDTNSRNGTMLNRTKLTANNPTELYNNASVVIGKTTLVFTFDLNAINR